MERIDEPFEIAVLRDALAKATSGRNHHLGSQFLAVVLIRLVNSGGRKTRKCACFRQKAVMHLFNLSFRELLSICFWDKIDVHTLKHLEAIREVVRSLPFAVSEINVGAGSGGDEEIVCSVKEPMDSKHRTTVQMFIFVLAGLMQLHP